MPATARSATTGRLAHPGSLPDQLADPRGQPPDSRVSAAGPRDALYGPSRGRRRYRALDGGARGRLGPPAERDQAHRGIPSRLGGHRSRDGGPGYPTGGARPPPPPGPRQPGEGNHGSVGTTPPPRGTAGGGQAYK